MNATINFDDEPRSTATEVDNESANDNLSAETRFELSQVMPQGRLGWRRLGTHRDGPLLFLLRLSTAQSHPLAPLPHSGRQPPPTSTQTDRAHGEGVGGRGSPSGRAWSSWLSRRRLRGAHAVGGPRQRRRRGGGAPRGAHRSRQGNRAYEPRDRLDNGPFPQPLPHGEGVGGRGSPSGRAGSSWLSRRRRGLRRGRRRWSRPRRRRRRGCRRGPGLRPSTAPA